MEREVCQNSLFIEITLATVRCGEGDFLFMRASKYPPFMSLQETQSSHYYNIKGDVSRSFDTSPFPLKAEYINYSQGEVYEL